MEVEHCGDAALASYRPTNTETGHKDPALNTTDHYDLRGYVCQAQGSMACNLFRLLGGRRSGGDRIPGVFLAD